MKTITKRWWGCGLVALCAVLAVLCAIAGLALLVKKIGEPATVETKWKPKHHEAATIDGDDFDRAVKSAMDRAKEEELRKLVDTARPPDNPFEGDAEREVRLRKYGFALIGADGKEWGRVHRLDDDEITKGLFPSTIVIETETKAKPVVTYSSDHWEVTFETPKEAK